MDETHRKWFIGSLAGLLIAAVIYIPYSRTTPQGANGGTAAGLAYGSIASAFMLFAGLLGARKKVPIWRVGRAQAWMRGHLWLGFISFPLIFFHSGFRFGVGLTRALMWLFVVVFVSGIVGAILQHFMPRLTTQRIPLETIYEQIGRVRSLLVAEAQTLVAEASSALAGNVSQATEEQRAASASAGTIGGLTVASGLQVDEGASDQLQEFFRREMQPYIAHSGSMGMALADRNRSQSMFQQLRLLLPPNLHPSVDDLENICEEKRELDQQTQYHRILHAWLLVHIPASYALLLLGAAHAVMALRY
ncbi:MAG: hypothetical protein ABSG23_03870 [Terriglobales bacterium]|jgi:hypothetical protein